MVDKSPMTCLGARFTASLLNGLFHQQQLVTSGREVMETELAAGAALLGCVEADLAAGEGDDHVVAVPFKPVDHDHFLLPVVDDGGQMAPVGTEIEIVLDALVWLLLLA